MSSSTPAMARWAGRSPAAPGAPPPPSSLAASPKWSSVSLRASESLFFDVRGLRYHVRHWPSRGAPKGVLLHGWMDVSASFQFLVEELRRDWDVYAPDWRGYGLTDWGKSDCYWLPDYLADLDALLDQVDSSSSVNLVGHSLGGNVAVMYAGVRPARVAKLVNLEGFGMQATRP